MKGKIINSILFVAVLGFSVSAAASGITEPSYLNYSSNGTVIENSETIERINAMNQATPSAMGQTNSGEPGYLNYRFTSNAVDQTSTLTFDSATMKPYYNDYK